MSIERRWYVYDETLPGGYLQSDNYFLMGSFPSCQCSGNQICCIYGIYDDGTNPPYGDHPKPFSSQLESYINSAFSLKSCFPNGSNKEYVYVKSV